jgi:hypothetical protein
LGATVKSHLAVLLVSVPLGGAAFVATCSLLNVPELNDAEKAIAGPLMRRLGPSKKSAC